MSCKLYPQIKNKSGQLVDSTLYKEVLSLTKDRDLTKIIYAMVKSKETSSIFERRIISKYGEDLNSVKDENGEYKFEVISNILNLKDIVDDNVKIKEFESKLNRSSNKNLNELLSKTIQFNEDNPNYVAEIVKTPDGNKIVVKTKNDNNFNTNSKLKANSTLNERLINELNKVGVTVTDDLDSTTEHGVFDPTNAYKTADNLLVLIKIIKGELGQDALPEEISHFLIESLGNEPIVKRLLSLIENLDLTKQILGESYDIYKEKYNNDNFRLIREAAGKLLSKYLKNESFDIDQSYKPLIQRVWQRIKMIFSKLNPFTIQKHIDEVNSIVNNLSKSFQQGSLYNLIDVELATKANTLYALKTGIQSLTDIVNKIIDNKIISLNVYKNRRDGKTFTEIESKKIKKLQESITNNKMYVSLQSFHAEVNDQLIKDLEYLKELRKEGDIKLSNDQTELRRIAIRIRSMKNILTSYKEPLKDMVHLDYASYMGEIEIAKEISDELSNNSAKLLEIINSIETDINKISKKIVIKVLHPLVGDSLVVPHGKDKGKVITVEDIIESDDKDLSFINAFLTSASDSTDLLLTFLDKFIKINKHERDMAVLDLTHEMRKIHNTFLQKGGKNTEFIYEKDANGLASGFLISDRDHVKYEKAKKDYFDSLKEKGLSEDEIDIKMKYWENTNTVSILLDPDTERWIRVPNKVYYPSNALSKLNSNEREYYDKYMNLKKEFDLLLPSGKSYLYKAVQMRNETLEILKNTKGSDIVKTLGSEFADKFVRRETDDERGELKENSTEREVLLDYNNKEINQIPVFLTTMIEDKRRLSLDATSAMIAYGAMAMNYESLYRIVDFLELGRTVLEERTYNDYSGGKKLVQNVKSLFGEVKKDKTINGINSEVLKRYNTLLEMQVYGKIKKDETAKILGKEVDLAKVGDTIISATSATTLGVNLFAGLNNVNVAKYSMLIEAVAGEHFTLKEYALSEPIYWSEIPNVIAELGSNMKSSKLGLLGEIFDLQQDGDRESKDHDFHKSTLMRLFGKGKIYFLQSMGEHYVQHRLMISLLKAYKLKDSKGNNTNLYDAYTVKKETLNGEKIDAKLELKDTFYKEDGTKFTEEDFMDVKFKLAKINQSLNGIYNLADRSAMQQYVLGRMAIMFRKWMEPHFSRRYKKLYYDAQSKQWREGFHRTMLNFLHEIGKEAKAGQLNIIANWEKLTPYQKANIKRSGFEIGFFIMLSTLIALIGSWKDKETWAGRMLVYQLRRMHLELGVTMYPPMMITEGMTIIQSPSAAIRTFGMIGDTINVFDVFKTTTVNGEEVNTWVRNLKRNSPVYGNWQKIKTLTTEDTMFNIFK